MEQKTKPAMAIDGDTLTWLTQTVTGLNSLRGVELDTRHGLLHQFQAMCMLFLWILAYFIKLLANLFSSVPLLQPSLKKLSSFAESYDSSNWVVVAEKHHHYDLYESSKSPIARALAQVLALVNDVPASSNKYEFLQDLADRVIEENRAEGLKFNSVNQVALRGGFSRTISLLGQSLEGRQQRGSFLGRVVRQSSGLLTTVPLPGPFERLRSLLSGWMLPRSTPPHLTMYADTDIAEKFAKELLWMATKMQNCGGMEDAVQQWSSVPALAELSLCASPKVQKSLVRLSALLCSDLVGNTNIPQEMRLQMVLLWLPLLCNATHGGDSPIFSIEEKREAEKQLERVVATLPDTDQEQVLSTWLQAYALSQSDFPNLQKCYNEWYSSMRKLGFGMPRIEKSIDL
jgi:hypothetical protein